MAFYNTPEDLVTRDQIDQAIASVKEAIAKIDPVVFKRMKQLGIVTAYELNQDHNMHDKLNHLATYDDHFRMALYFITMLTIKPKPHPDDKLSLL